MSSKHTRATIAWLSLMIAPAAVAGQARGGAAAQATVQTLPPLSYVCVMPGDEDVIEDKPGSCPKCKMDLVPVRLDAKWWCPVHQANEVHDGPGTCRRDGRQLVQVTLSESWTCADTPDKKLTEPGRCADGSVRKIGYELRAHGDHNPRHGGQFFMATDAWHHVEGTYPQNGIFRAFFYDNFTKPLAVKGKGFSGTVVVRDASDKEIASAPLAIGTNGSTMEATIPPANTALPLRVTLKMKFGDKIPEQPFDFQFNALSKDTAPPGTVLGPSATPRSTAAVAPARKPNRTVPTPAPGTPKVAPAPPAQALQPSDLYAGEIAPMPPALAAAVDETGLPADVPDLLTELTKRLAEVDSLMKQGALAEIWLPAMGTKTVALVLNERASSLSAARRIRVTAASARVVTAAWQIDGYGDLGNGAKIVESYQRMEAAVAELKSAFEDAP